MFPFLFGFFGLEMFDKIFNIKLMSNTKKWVDFNPSLSILNTIAIYEEGGFSSLKTTAYTSKGDQNPTIGYGTVSIYDNNGIYKRSVKSGETLQSIKSYLGLSNMSDSDFGKQLMLNYLKSATKYKKIASILDASGVPFDENLAIGLYDFSYNSGGAFNLTKNQLFANDVKLANGDKKKIAGIYLRFRFGYVKSNLNPKVNYNSVKGGWARRYYHNAKRIQGININYSTLTSSQAINGCVSDYAFLI